MTDTIETPAAVTTFNHFIAGQWSSVHQRRDLREPQPRRHARRHRAVPAGHRRRRRHGDQGGRGRPADVASDARPQARRDPVPVRRPDGGAQGAPVASDDPRDGQGPRRGARRRPGGHRHRVPDGGRRPPDVRRHGPVRAARQVGDVDPPAAGHRRDHHPLELPDRHPVLEDDAGPGDRQHRRLQAVQRHAALRDARRGADGRGRLPARRRQPRDGERRRGRRRDRRKPGRRP